MRLGLRYLIIAALLAVAFCAQAAKKPNVVVFFVDDMGYGEAGCYGSKDLRTPHIDSLAENGVRCTAGYKGWYAVRAGDWKLVYDDKEQATGLFNLAEDVGEKNNLIKSHPEKAAELEALWRKWNQKNAVPLWQTPTALEKMRKAYGNEGMATLK